MTWAIHDMAAVHVVPDDDLIDHDLSPDCACGPRAEFYERPLLVHHSLDGREADE